MKHAILKPETKHDSCSKQRKHNIFQKRHIIRHFQLNIYNYHISGMAFQIKLYKSET